jgi:hypothetical protein
VIRRELMGEAAAAHDHGRAARHHGR